MKGLESRACWVYDMIVHVQKHTETIPSEYTDQDVGLSAFLASLKLAHLRRQVRNASLGF